MLMKHKQNLIKNKRNRTGITAIETMSAAVIAVIATFSVAIALSDSERGFKAMYNRVYSNVVTDSHIARRMFDSVVRKSCSRAFFVSDDGTWFEVCYYSDSDAVAVDRYICLNWDDTHLYAEYGRIHEDGVRETLSYRAVCGNVTNCTFKQTGRSLQMLLTLSNGSEEMTTVTSAFMHN
jgi:hypothetical protein